MLKRWRQAVKVEKTGPLIIKEILRCGLTVSGQRVIITSGYTHSRILRTCSSFVLSRIFSLLSPVLLVFVSCTVLILFPKSQLQSLGRYFVLKRQYPRSKHTKIQKNAVYEDKTQHAIYRGNPLYQATKRHLGRGKLSGQSVGLVIERSRVRGPAGAAG